MGITQSTIMALKLLVLVALAAYKCDALPTATNLVVPEANTISSDQKQTTFYEKQTTYDIVDDNAQTDKTGDRLLEVEGGCTNTPTEAPTEAPASGHGSGSGFGEGSGSQASIPPPVCHI